MSKVAKQARTTRVSISTIMRDPAFERGLSDIRSGKPFSPPNANHDWGYERGRLFGAIAPLHMPLKNSGKINPKALRLCTAAFERRYII
jgi:hypothetical protein